MKLLLTLVAINTVIALCQFSPGFVLNQIAASAEQPLREHTPKPPLNDWRLVAVDGLSMRDYSPEEVDLLSRSCQKTGKVHFVNRTYRRLHWSDERDVLFVRLDDRDNWRLDRVIGVELSVAGRPVLKRGDTEQVARELLGENLWKQWGKDIKDKIYLRISAELEARAVATVTFQVPYARPAVPLP